MPAVQSATRTEQVWQSDVRKGSGAKQFWAGTVTAMAACLDGLPAQRRCFYETTSRNQSVTPFLDLDHHSDDIPIDVVAATRDSALAIVASVQRVFAEVGVELAATDILLACASGIVVKDGRRQFKSSWHVKVLSPDVFFADVHDQKPFWAAHRDALGFEYDASVYGDRAFRMLFNEKMGNGTTRDT